MTAQRNRSPHLWILFLLLAAAGTALVIAAMTGALRSRKISLEKAVRYVQSEYVFGRIALSPDGKDSLTVRLALLTPEANTALERTFSLPGSDVFLESRVLVIEHEGLERTYVFPSRLYSDTLPASEGIDLIPLYVRDGFPAHYALLKDDPEWNATVKAIYIAAWAGPEEAGNNTAFADLPVKMRLDAALHRGPYRDNRGGVYELLAHPNGGLELREVP